MNLFSILITDNPDGMSPTAQNLPPVIARNIESFKTHHPDLPHRLFDKQSVRDFLAGSMEKDVLWAYDQLLPYAYKADLARMCLLHEFGGVYADLSVCFHGSWAPIPGKLSVFRDRAVVAPWIVSNTIIAAPPRFPAIEAAIRMIVGNCRARYRGKSSLCPTGPVLFGRAIAMHCEPDQIHLGEVTNVAGRDTKESLVFVDATDGRLIGYRAKSRTGLTELGLREGVNNYNDFYYAGVIYADNFPLTVTAAYLHKHRDTGCALVNDELVYRCETPSDGTENLLILGNFVPLSAGTYTVLLDISSASEGSLLTLFAILSGNGKELSRTTVMVEKSGSATLSLHFDLPESRNDVAIGFSISRSTFLSLRQMRIHRSTGVPENLPATLQRLDVTNAE